MTLIDLHFIRYSCFELKWMRWFMLAETFFFSFLAQTFVVDELCDVRFLTTGQEHDEYHTHKNINAIYTLHTADCAVLNFIVI